MQYSEVQCPAQHFVGKEGLLLSYKVSRGECIGSSRAEEQRELLQDKQSCTTVMPTLQIILKRTFHSTVKEGKMYKNVDICVVLHLFCTWFHKKSAVGTERKPKVFGLLFSLRG